MLIKSILIFLAFVSPLSAQTADDIIRRAEDAIKGKSAHGVIEMTVVTPDYTREMRMESWWVGNHKALIITEKPRKEAGNKTLKIGNEMWNYLSNTETTIKIPPSMMLQAWNGSDFTNDDLVRESNLNDDYTQTLIGTDTLDGSTCWLIELRPRPDAPVVWGKLNYWVRQEDYLPARVSYFDEGNALIRTLDYGGYQQMNGRKVPSIWTMNNLAKPGRRTEIRLVKMDYNIAIPDRIFSFRELESRR